MAVEFMDMGPRNASATVLLAHGAGAPMDSPAMTMIAEALAAEEVRVARFEFGYMAARRTGAGRRPPPRADRLLGEYIEAVDALDHQGLLVIGGKSMGGRVASMVADELHAAGRIAGLICLGYPFHPPAKPERLRVAHLEQLETPTLIFQGARDPFGTLDEVSSYALSATIELVWLEDGDHDLKPRKRITGRSAADHMRSMAERTSAWISGLRRFG